MKLKKIIASLPIIGDQLSKIYHHLNRHTNFIGSKMYWETRYASGGSSGSGSYGRLAFFKANVLNDFVRQNKIQSVLEYGCGDGNQLSLATYPNYIGLDVSQTAILMCRDRFSNDTSKQFYLVDSMQPKFKAELVISLDVIYHLIEEDNFETYMNSLFSTAEKYVIIYSSNFEAPQRHHEKTRKFADWIDRSVNNWQFIKIIENPYRYDSNDPSNTSQSDFYFYKALNKIVE